MFRTSGVAQGGRKSAGSSPDCRPATAFVLNKSQDASVVKCESLGHGVRCEDITPPDFRVVASSPKLFEHWAGRWRSGPGRTKRSGPTGR